MSGRQLEGNFSSGIVHALLVATTMVDHCVTAEQTDLHTIPTV